MSEKPPPGFSAEAWAALNAQIDKHTDPETDTVDVDAFNAEVQASANPNRNLNPNLNPNGEVDLNTRTPKAKTPS